jgi:hypothetical protein
MTDNPAFYHPDLGGSESTDQNNAGGQPEQLLAGKYKSVDELERGYQNLFSEGQKLVERIRALEEQGQYRPAPNWEGEAADRVDPATRVAQRQDPVDALSLAGIPVHELDEFVRKRIAQEIQPVFQGAQARQTVAQDYPEFSKHEGELAQFVEANPQLKARYNRVYNADPEAALKWLFNEYMRGQSAPRESASGEAQAAARLDAALPGRVQPQRRSPGDFDTETYNKLREEALKTGDWSRALAFKLRSTIPDGHYEPIG